MTDWPPSKTEIAAFFNERAATYDRSDMHRWLAAQTVQRMTLPQWGTFLDLGAGTGLASREIAARVDRLQSRFIAVDLASDLLAAAKRASAGNFTLETIEADVEDLPLGSAIADAAVCVAAVAYLHYPLKAFREWHRVLRPRGQLGFQVFATNTMTAPRVFRAAAATQGLSFTDPNEAMGSQDIITRTLADAGFLLENIASATWSTSIPDADAFWRIMSTGVLATPLASLEAEVKAELRSEFTARLAEASEAQYGTEDHHCYFVRAFAV
jgi:ubiquinone/menaquinone biosynthesis C-methylase UbiE